MESEEKWEKAIQCLEDLKRTLFPENYHKDGSKKTLGELLQEMQVFDSAKLEVLKKLIRSHGYDVEKMLHLLKIK